MKKLKYNNNNNNNNDDDVDDDNNNNNNNNNDDDDVDDDNDNNNNNNNDDDDVDDDNNNNTRKRHDRVAQVIHLDLSEKCGFQITASWYDQKPDQVCDSEKYKLLWDFKIQTDQRMDHNKPHVVLLNKEERPCLIIDVACPFDTRVLQGTRVT